MDDIIGLASLTRMLKIGGDIGLDDMGRVALKLYHDANHDILGALEGSTQFECKQLSCMI